MTDILATIQRSLKAPKDKENKFGGYNYRNAESILRAFKEVQPEGVSLTMSDAITFIGDRLFLVATVKLHHGGADGIHTRREWWVQTYGSDTDYLPVVQDMLAGQFNSPWRDG